MHGVLGSQSETSKPRVNIQFREEGAKNKQGDSMASNSSYSQTERKKQLN